MWTGKDGSNVKVMCEKVCQRVWESDESLCAICFSCFLSARDITFFLCGELRIESKTGMSIVGRMESSGCKGKEEEKKEKKQKELRVQKSENTNKNKAKLLAGSRMVWMGKSYATSQLTTHHLTPPLLHSTAFVVVSFAMVTRLTSYSRIAHYPHLPPHCSLFLPSRKGASKSFDADIRYDDSGKNTPPSVSSLHEGQCLQPC